MRALSLVLATLVACTTPVLAADEGPEKVFVLKNGRKVRARLVDPPPEQAIAAGLAKERPARGEAARRPFARAARPRRGLLRGARRGGGRDRRRRPRDLERALLDVLARVAAPCA